MLKRGNDLEDGSRDQGSIALFSWSPVNMIVSFFFCSGYETPEEERIIRETLTPKKRKKKQHNPTTPAATPSSLPAVPSSLSPAPPGTPNSVPAMMNPNSMLTPAPGGVVYGSPINGTFTLKDVD